MLTVVIGGARSGKSRLAERLATGTDLPRTYVATAEAWDAEMRDRIALHRNRRTAGWTTVEAPLHLGPVLTEARAGSVLLIDCATLWLTNHLLAEHDLDAETARMLDALAACAASVILVTNEVGLSIVPENALARQFRDAQGLLNQRVADQADLVVLVVAGLPLVLKGRLP